MEPAPTYTAFAGHRRVASGDLPAMLRGAKRHLGPRAAGAILIFEDQTGRQVDFDFRGSADEVVARATAAASDTVATPARPGPGRPRLGVVSREVSLLPRHWEWLEQQPQGISAALRRLVDEHRKREPAADRARRARDAAGRFMWAIAGNFENFEEATRALYAGDAATLKRLIRKWPPDVRNHVTRLLETPRRATKGR